MKWVVSLRGEASVGSYAVGAWALLALLAGCGGGTGTVADSGTNKTYLSVAATDADGDGLHYQWRATGGTIENRDSKDTVWTMPDGPGLHFAYVTVSDGKGGYAVQQYAVGSDALGTEAPVRAPVVNVAPAVVDFSGSTTRLRFGSPDDTQFAAAAGGTPARRQVYLPDMPVQVVAQASGLSVFDGLSDLSGEVDLPKLQAGQVYQIRCATNSDAALAACGSFTAGTTATLRNVAPPLTAASNLRLYGHVAFADGGVCGTQDEFFNLQSAATVQLLQADGTALTPAVRVNRFGDYAIDAGVPVRASLKLQVRCEAYASTLDVPGSPDPAGYVAARPIELSHVVANSRPAIAKMVAAGADGNVRGRMIVAEPGAASNGLPGALQFLAYKGKDTRMSACVYYRALGAAKDCDAQGNLVEAISFEDWKRLNAFVPYAGANTEVAANYINKMDLNLVRRMVATQAAPDRIAFYVCNHPGPDGTTQLEVDSVLDTGLADVRRVACVAMEWSVTPGVNGGLPFTKFFTFAPSGALIASINLDGRGEKFMPGACIACHGGSVYNGRFPDKGTPSPYLGSGFLPFDTGNFLFGSRPELTEAAQGAALHALNNLVRATETSNTTAVSKLVQGWYAGGTDTLDKTYVPDVWRIADGQPTTAGAARFYREVVGSSCRTCHASLGPTFDWDATVLTPSRARTHVCGGTDDLATNASMPNALISRDRVQQRIDADASLGALATTFLGCAAPLPDPVYPKR